MAAAVIYRLAGSPEAAGAGTPAFADVDAAAWYAPAVLWAAGSGIIDGVAEGAFAPGEGVTREALAACSTGTRSSPAARPRRAPWPSPTPRK